MTEISSIRQQLNFEDLYRSALTKRRIFTFGLGSPLRHKYIVIHAVDPRIVMIYMFGRRWAFEYKDEDSAGVDRYNLTKLAELYIDPDYMIECAKVVTRDLELGQL